MGRRSRDADNKPWDPYMSLKKEERRSRDRSKDRKRRRSHSKSKDRRVSRRRNSRGRRSRDRSKGRRESRGRHSKDRRKSKETRRSRGRSKDKSRSRSRAKSKEKSREPSAEVVKHLEEDDELLMEADQAPPPAPKKSEPKSAMALQREIDQLDAKLDEVKSVYDLYCIIGDVEDQCAVPEISSSQKLTLYHTTVRKACDLFCSALVERVLFFIQKFLNVNNIREIDVVTFRFLDKVGSLKVSDRSVELMKVIQTKRKNRHSDTLFPGRQFSAKEDDITRQGKALLEQFIKNPLKKPPSSKLTPQEEVQAYFECLTKRKELSIAQSIERVKKVFVQTGQLTQEVSPFSSNSGERLQNPCVGVECSHVQCFELLPFLNTVLTQRRRGKRGAWRCPICNRIINENTIMYDKLMASIIPTISEAYEGIEMHYDGSWVPLKHLRATISSIGEETKKEKKAATVDVEQIAMTRTDESDEEDHAGIYGKKDRSDVESIEEER